MSRDKASTQQSLSGKAAPGELRYEWDGKENPTTAFVRAVADAKGLDPMDMPPLQEYVDADALNDLLANSGDRLGNITVTVRYDDVAGRLNSDGELVILADEPRPE